MTRSAAWRRCETCCRLHAGREPLQFSLRQDHVKVQLVANLRYDVRLGPAGVTATQLRSSGCAVASEDPLLAVCVFKIADVDVRIIALDDRRIAAGWGVVVTNGKQRFGHGDLSEFQFRG
jgi:hypothetical protein